MAPSLRQEIQCILNSLENQADKEVYQGVRDAILKHAFFETDLETGSDRYIDFKGLSSAIESSVLLAKVDTQGNILKVNDNFYVLTGFDSEDLLGKPIAMLSSGLHDDEYLSTVWDKIIHGSVWRGEIKKRAKNGEILWLNATIVPVVDDEGVIQHFISMYIDISKRKKAEEDLELMLQMVNLSNDAIHVVKEDGTLFYVNQRSADNLGYKRQDLIGKSVLETEEKFPDIASWKRHVEEVKSKPEGFLSEGVNIREDGSTFAVEANVRWMRLGDDGYIVAVIRDISERKLNQELVVKTQYILSEAQMLANIASFEVDLDKGTILHSDNAWKVFGFGNKTDFSVENLIHRVHNEDIDRIRSSWFEAIVEHRTVQANFRVRDNEGNIQYLHGIARLLNYGNEKTGTMICTAQNISGSEQSRIVLERRTKELEHRNAELDQFAQIVSHDLKSPLRAIYNLSEWIKEAKTKNGEEMDVHIAMLQKRIQRMENLVNGILSYSSAGKNKQDTSFFSASEVLSDLCESYRNINPNVRIILDDLPDMHEDRLAFEQVFSNLISNAVKHNTNPNPEVVIRYEFEPGEHHFFVEDNGPGIEPDFHQKIFQIFQTLESRDQRENTGVGLAIVKKICDENSWNVQIIQRNNPGTCFAIHIPIR
ncbi:MAG: PAS domain S-box protein [Bacteroidetes bacterium]|nr:PAS domain S-box protein [Bacteroidota bacterium]